MQQLSRMKLAVRPVRNKHYGYPRYNARLPNQIPFMMDIQRRRSKTLKVTLAVMLSASAALTAFVVYETMVHDSPVYIPLYVVRWSRPPLKGELGGAELEQKLRDKVKTQLEQRMAVDETVGAVLGVPCQLEDNEEYEVVVNAPGPSMVCLKISPKAADEAMVSIGGAGWSYQQVARPLLWWLGKPSGSNDTPEIDTIIRMGDVGAQDVGEQHDGNDDDDDKAQRKWWWDLDEQEIVIKGTVKINGPGPNCHSAEGPSAPKSGELSFKAVKSLYGNDVGLRFKRAVLVYYDDDGHEIHQRLC